MSKQHFYRQTFLLALICGILMPMLSYCTEDTDFDDLPAPIQKFVAKYYPEIAVEDYNFSNGVYTVSLRGSAMMHFDAQMVWTSVDGRGGVLPQMFLYDEMPEAVYEFTETTGSIGRVYSATRNSSMFALHLLDQDIVYDIASGQVSTVTAKAADL